MKRLRGYLSSRATLITCLWPHGERRDASVSLDFSSRSRSPVLLHRVLGVRVAWSLSTPANWSTWRPLFKAVFHLEANKMAETDYTLPGNRTLRRDVWVWREIWVSREADSAITLPEASFSRFHVRELPIQTWQDEREYNQERDKSWGQFDMRSQPTGCHQTRTDTNLNPRFLHNLDKNKKKKSELLTESRQRNRCVQVTMATMTDRMLYNSLTRQQKCRCDCGAAFWTLRP